MTSTPPTKVIEIPALGNLRIELDTPDTNIIGRWRGGRAYESWVEELSFDVDDPEDLADLSAMTAVSDLVVTHAMEGVDVTAPAYVAGVVAYLRRFPRAIEVGWLTGDPPNVPGASVSD